MSYAVVHMQKFTRGSVRGIQSHNQREKPSKKNPDIDYSRSMDNYDLLNPDNINYNREITRRIEQFRKPGKAVRKDAIVLCNILVSSDSGFFKDMPGEEIRKFFNESLDFFARRYGPEKIVNATVHLDETTPHMHLGLVPITPDGRLSAKSLFDKKELKSLQTDYVRDVGCYWNLERGKEGSGRTHLSEQQFKAEMARQETEKALAETIRMASKARKMGEDVKKQEQAIETLSMEKNVLKGQINDLRDVLMTYQDIDGIGEKSGLMGKKVTMTADEAQRLKDQAKSSFAERSRRQELERRTSYLESIEKDADSIRSEITNLKKELKGTQAKLEGILRVIRSSPELRKGYHKQAALIRQEQEREETERKEQLKPKGLER